MANTILQQPHPSPIASKIRTIALAIVLGLGVALTVGSNAAIAGTDTFVGALGLVTGWCRLGRSPTIAVDVN